MKLLPDDFRRAKSWNPDIGPFVDYKPAFQSFWTWRPKPDVELLVGTIIDDPAKAGKPKGDLNQDYGAIAVLKRNAGKPELLLVRKTGESPPAVAAGKDGTVTYAFGLPCGDLRGTLSWDDSKVVVKEQTCEEISQ